MEAALSLNPLIRLPISSSRTHEDSLVSHSLLSTRKSQKGQQRQKKQLHLLVVEAKGKKGMAARQYQLDEKEIQKMAMQQHRALRSATEFRYGYKLVEKNNLRATLSSNDVIELPRKEELKTVLDKVKDFFGDVKESFGKLTSLNASTESVEEDSKQQAKEKFTVKG